MAQEVREAAALGYVQSVTTNPALLAVTGLPAEAVLRELCEIVSGTVFYQLTAMSADERRAEGEAMLQIVPGRIGLKIPATTENMRLVAHFSASATIAVTAIFSGGQAIAACAAGAQYLLPYVNRSTRLMGDGPAFVRLLRSIADEIGGGTRILAASIKSAREAVDTLLAGAQDLSMPLSVLRDLGEHPLSHAAIAEFARAAGIRR